MLNIYIEDLASKIHYCSVGRWITLPMKKEELRATLDKMYEDGEAIDRYGEIHEEYEIQDWEWNENIPSIFEPDIRSCDIFTINEYVSLIKKNVEPEDYKIVKFIIEQGIDLEKAVKKIDEVDMYENSTLEDVARCIFDDYYGSKIDELIVGYIDFKKWGNELLLDNYCQVDNDVFCFDDLSYD